MFVSGCHGVLLASVLVSAALADAPPRMVTSVTVPGTGLEVKLATQVGLPYDAPTIAADVRYLWGLARFDDIRVETADRDGGVAVIFRVTISPHRVLHEVRILPNTFGLDVKVPVGTPITPLSAYQIAMEAQRQLNQEGYQNAHVRYELAPAIKGEVDLRLTLDIGKAIRVKQVRLEGDSSFRDNLQALRIRRITPGIPYLWDGWRLLPSYSPEAVDSEIAHLRSLYLAKGFFDAQVRPGAIDIHGKNARVAIVASPGRRYSLDPGLCTTLFLERREAERQGVLGFSARIDSHHLKNQPSLELGRSYRVGRIEFTGNHHYRDATIRSNFLIAEGAPFDEYLLRKSIARLNRAMLFENVDAKNE